MPMLTTISSAAWRMGLRGPYPASSILISLSSSSRSFHRPQISVICPRLNKYSSLHFGFSGGRLTQVQKQDSTERSAAFASSSSSSSASHVAPTIPSLVPTDATEKNYTEKKIIRIKRDTPTIKVQNNEQIAIEKARDHLNGYKYRLLTSNLLTTSQLTKTEKINESERNSDLRFTNEDPQSFRPTFEENSLLTVTPTTSQVREKENYYIHLLQQQYDNDDVREDSNDRLQKGIQSVLSGGWWRTLYQNNKDQTQIETGSPRYSHQHPQSSMRSRRSSFLLDEMINNDSYTGFLPDERQSMEGDEAISDRIRVRSVQAASSIDVVAVLSKVFGGGVARSSQYTDQHPLSDFFATSPPLRHVFGRTNIIIQLSPPPINGHPSLSPTVPRYVVVYRFGAVVFFNVTTKESSRLLEQIKKYAVNPISIGFERREHFEVALQPKLETATGKITSDTAIVRELDMNTVGIVSNIMGQTVALDWHNDTVDELLAKFSSVNSSVERTGSFTSIERNTLFQVVARNNSLFIDMVGKLGIKDRSDTAWHLSQYEGLHEGMKIEFELDERFQNVEFKLDLIQQNAKFFLEVHDAQKSNALEWVIVILITFECGLMMLDMSGKGEALISLISFF
ncbi:hypothetical protein ACHAW5_002156 [Stephanodiscus triporus]|uniref:DUF155 domain-containing protein n=1 Tax=Stephanodiscus triporus TaxID=2934178 RepID=A0ABD3Q4L1_9STRA